MKKFVMLSLAIILLGIFLLGFTFYLAYSAFVNPEILKRFNILIPSVDVDQPFHQFNVLIGYAVAFLLLWVMGSVASKMVKYGVSFYRASSPKKRKEKEKEKKEED
ncbi:MAG: hypothetical protein ACKD6N_00670 [Candidatus Bathyarchaeota archaeon]